MNSTLGSVVPLAIFIMMVMILWVLAMVNRNEDSVGDGDDDGS